MVDLNQSISACKYLMCFFQSEDTKSSGEFQAIKGKKVVGVGLGNIFGGGPIKLRPTGDKGVKNQVSCC